jgi:ribosomal protein S18 acetylase RimI-like enzyme
LQCDSVEPWEHGSVLRTPSVPGYWDLNAVRVETPGVSAEAMMAAADRHLGGCAHRKLYVEDEATGAAVRPLFDAAGWDTERHTMMARVGPAPDRPHGAHEVPLSATRALRTAWYGAHADAAFMAAQDRVSARRGMRAFMTGEDGYVLLAPGADAVEIDSLYVAEHARGRGLGALLIATALAAGGRDVAWIVADDEGLARPLYERLGFRTVWRYHDFLRRPDAS